MIKHLLAAIAALCLAAVPAAAQEISVPGGFAPPVSASCGTLSTTQVCLGLSATWATNGTYVAPLQLNVTDSGTAAAASLLFDLQVGGSSKFTVSKAGLGVATGLRVNGTTVPTGVGIYATDANSTLSFTASGAWAGNIDAGGTAWSVPNGWVLGWGSSAGAGPATAFSRLSNGVVALGNGSASNASGTLVLTKAQLNSTSGPFWSGGSGSPEGSVTAPVGSLYSRTDGGAGTSLYVKESGAGNTGWVGK